MVVCLDCSNGTRILWNGRLIEEKNDSRELMLKFFLTHLNEISSVIVASPGSFSGTRASVAFLKGLQIPFYSVNIMDCLAKTPNTIVLLYSNYKLPYGAYYCGINTHFFIEDLEGLNSFLTPPMKIIHGVYDMNQEIFPLTGEKKLFTLDLMEKADPSPILYVDNSMKLNCFCKNNEK